MVLEESDLEQPGEMWVQKVRSLSLLLIHKWKKMTMIILKVILMLAAAFALCWQIRIKKIFPVIITVGMITGIIIVLMLPNTSHLAGILIYMAFVALAFTYGLAATDKRIGARIVVILMSAGIFTYWLWILNHWHGNELLAPVLTLIAGLAGIISKVKLKNELGFLLLMATDAFAIIIEHLLKST